MKRKILVRCMIVWVAICITVCFFGCTKASESDFVVYGSIKFTARRKQLTVTHYQYDEKTVSEIEEYRKENGIPYEMASFYYMSNDRILATIRDVSECKGENITYVNKEDISSFPNAVVSTKWVYFYSLLVKEIVPELSEEQQKIFLTTPRTDISNELGVPLFDDWQRFNTLINDKYCMEKVCLEPSEYVCTKESSPCFGKTLKEIFSQGLEKQLPTHQAILFAVALENGDKFFSNSDGAWTDPLMVAVMARYGLIDVNAMEKKVGKIYLPNGKELNVVGYVETEADKMMSSGVSMDPESAGYKNVTEQLKNTVFYSVCGDFLMDVNN